MTDHSALAEKINARLLLASRTRLGSEGVLLAVAQELAAVELRLRELENKEAEDE